VSYHSQNYDIPDHRISANMDFPALLCFDIANLEIFLYYLRGRLSSCEDLWVLRVLLYRRKVSDIDEASRWFLLATAFALISSFS